ncbi:MAG TPA: Spo0E family sporulation regulatory protein-aspartic acid phosphatase [Epulopiscium sp.]|nr:Spo0E family sporulation regulatory protein-aspartic acid phosphatase [Candidatus Epulonipiscium sp.]
MMCETSLESLEKQIMQLREALESSIGNDISNLSSPEVLKINNEIDKLLVSYIKLTI